MTESAPFNTPSLVIHLRDGSRLVAQPETVLQLRYRNKRGPTVGLSDIRKIELRLDENEPGRGAPACMRVFCKAL